MQFFHVQSGKIYTGQNYLNRPVVLVSNMRYGWIFFHCSVANMMVIALLEMMVKVKVMVALVVNAMMVMVALIRVMVVVLIRAGSEAMIGYSPAVLATDRGTEEQPAALKGALIALRHIKILTILTPTHTFF